MGKYTRRGSLVFIATGASMLVFDTAGFSTVEGDRTGDTNVSSDVGALIGLTVNNEPVAQVLSTANGPPTEPQTITIENNTNATFEDTGGDGPITVTSENDKFNFRATTGSGGDSKLTGSELNQVGKLPFVPGDTIDIGVLSASNQTGTVEDTVSFKFDSDEDDTAISIERDIALQFSSVGQLVYAVSGDIQVYGSLNDEISDPPEKGQVDSVGSIVADITGDGDADIAYTKGKELELTQIGFDNSNDVVTIFNSGSKDSYPEPPTSKTRIAAADLKNFPVENDTFGDAAALFADSGANKLYAAQPSESSGGQEVDVLVDTSNVGGAGAAVGIDDIDDDGVDELVYVNSSQALRYIDPIDTSEYSKPNRWSASDDHGQNVSGQILSKYTKGNGQFKNTINAPNVGGTNSGDEWVYARIKLSNGSIGSNNNIGVSATGDFTGDDIKYLPMVDGSNNLRFVDHRNNKIVVNTSTSVGKKAAIAPVDFDNDDTTELAFIGKLSASGSGKPLPPVDTSNVNISDSTGPIFYLDNPETVIDNGGQKGTASFELLQVGSGNYDEPGVVKDSNTPGFIVPDGDIGLNAGTII